MNYTASSTIDIEMKDAMKRKLTFFIEKSTNVSGNNEFSVQGLDKIPFSVPLNVECD